MNIGITQNVQSENVSLQFRTSLLNKFIVLCVVDIFISTQLTEYGNCRMASYGCGTVCGN